MRAAGFVAVLTAGFVIPSLAAEPSGLQQPSSLSFRVAGGSAVRLASQEEPAEVAAPLVIDGEEPVVESIVEDWDACPGCENCRTRCGCCDLGEPWTLFGESCCGPQIGGWFSAGIYGNAHGAANNGPLAFNDVGDGFTVNQIWLFAAKEVDTGGCGFDWGYRVDFLFGADAPDTQAFGNFNGRGWDNQWDTARDYGFAMPQLYLEFGYNDWTLKLGHFYTIIGYEVVQAPDNFFYTHAYAQYYAEPFTHTGFLASRPISENVEVYGGFTWGWDTGFDDGGGAAMLLTGVSVTLSEQTSVMWAATTGDMGAGNGDMYMNSIVLQHALSDNLTYILQHDLGVNSNLPGTAEFYGVNNYLIYELNDCWSVGGRFEWFRDDDGARVPPGGNEGSYYNLTAGLNYKPNANMVIRPELRYDWFDGNVGGGGAPFNNGADTDQFSGGFDFIVTF